MIAQPTTTSLEDDLRAVCAAGGPWQFWAPPGRPGTPVDGLVAMEFERTRPGAAPTEYIERVARGLAAIERGEVDKVVLAREERLPPADPVDTLLELRRRFPTCWVFAISDGRETFLGATPELLARIAGRRLETWALAGTSAPGDDDLLHDEKELREHRYVVDAITDALNPLSVALEVAPTPELMRLPNVQHLRTEITATLRPAVTVAEVVDALHPTPAVCGSPRQAAHRLICELEPFARGLYTGVVGAIDGDRAELVVALRCARLTPDASYLYAGAGIVAGSSPAAEDAETRAKLRAVSDALRFL